MSPAARLRTVLASLEMETKRLGSLAVEVGALQRANAELTRQNQALTMKNLELSRQLSSATSETMRDIEGLL